MTGAHLDALAFRFDCPACGQHAIRVPIGAGGWRLLSTDPVTLDPSIATRCGSVVVHGHVIRGEWVPA